MVVPPIENMRYIRSLLTEETPLVTQEHTREVLPDYCKLDLIKSTSRNQSLVRCSLWTKPVNRDSRKSDIPNSNFESWNFFGLFWPFWPLKSTRWILILILWLFSLHLGIFYTTQQWRRCRPQQKCHPRHLQKMGTGSNRHGTPSTALTPWIAMALGPCCVNGLIDHNVFYVLPWTAWASLPSRVNGPLINRKPKLIYIFVDFRASLLWTFCRAIAVIGPARGSPFEVSEEMVVLKGESFIHFKSTAGRRQHPEHCHDYHSRESLCCWTSSIRRQPF